MEDLQILLSENLCKYVPESDAKYAEELQLQEALNASLIHLQALQSHIASSAIQEPAESSRSFCEICLERKEKHEMFQGKSCIHSFCFHCIGTYVQNKIQENVPAITCPGFKCKSTIEPASLRPIIPNHVIARWEEAFTESTIIASEKFYCPFRDCSAMLVKDNNREVIKESECPICRRLFCAQCRVPWHRGFDCEEFQKLDENERGIEDLMVRELAKNCKWMKCPNCNFFVDRTEGCIHMTCRCEFEFCYICGSRWTNSHWRCQDAVI